MATIEDVRIGVRLGESGEPEKARELFASLWSELESGGDALVRCFLAHSMADLQDDPREELRWDMLALAAAENVTDDQTAERNVPGGRLGLYPSLHLNIAETYIKLGDEAAAHEHYLAGRRHLDVLADDAYGRRLRAGFERFEAAHLSGQAPVELEPGRSGDHVGCVNTGGKLSQREIEELVASYTAQIAEAVPEGQTSVSGSTLLGEYGGHDVDLVVLVPEVAAAAERLRTLYPPLYEDEWREDWAAFRVEGPPQVDIVVTCPGSKGDDHHRRAWELLLSDPVLRAEYEALKTAGMDSVQKADFFDRVVARLRP